MMEWVKANGGYLHPHLEIKRVDPNNDPTSYYGVFANALIRQDEALIKIPDRLRIGIDDDADNDDDNDRFYSEMVCELSWSLAKEFEKGNESKYLPYINYLKTQEKGQIPGAWSSAGKTLLLQVHGDLPISDNYYYDEEEEEEEYSEAELMVNWLQDFANEECVVDYHHPDDDVTPAPLLLDPHLIALTIQRGYDSVLIPIYDMINHSNNPQKINIYTTSNFVEDDEEFVHALRDIAAGEELLYSYEECPECGVDEILQTIVTNDYWGTPELLRDFGFVEEYPQKFHISNDGRSIIIEQVELEDGQLGYVATCTNDKCPEKSWIEEKVHNLMDVEKSILEAESQSTVPERELAVIKDYHKALLVAFSSIWSQCPEPSFSMSARKTDDVQR